MKKIFLILLCLFVQTLASQAATQVKVTSMQSFSTDKPTENLRVKVREDVLLGNYELKESSELNCEIIKIVDPKRGKRNAKFFYGKEHLSKRPQGDKSPTAVDAY